MCHEIKSGLPYCGWWRHADSRPWPLQCRPPQHPQHGKWWPSATSAARGGMQLAGRRHRNAAQRRATASLPPNPISAKLFPPTHPTHPTNPPAVANPRALRAGPVPQPRPSRQPHRTTTPPLPFPSKPSPCSRQRPASHPNRETLPPTIRIEARLASPGRAARSSTHLRRLYVQLVLEEERHRQPGQTQNALDEVHCGPAGMQAHVRWDESAAGCRTGDARLGSPGGRTRGGRPHPLWALLTISLAMFDIGS